jgi:peptide/nickel transport system substrate-binding protein
MRKGFVILTGMLIVSLYLFAGLGLAASSKQEKKSSPKKSVKEMSRRTEPGSMPAGPGPEAVKGGVLKAIRSPFPKVLGYPPEQNPTDTIYALLYGERLSEWDPKGNLIPVLAESWEADPVNKTITYHLRKGVKFQDGTPFNAEACRWNLQLGKDTGRLTDGQFVKSIDVVDEYTVRITCTEYSSVSLLNYGWLQQYSPTAFNKYGKEYLRTHAVGTGPFKLTDFQRDTSIKYEKNNDYWRKGLPLLDGMEVQYVPNPMTASLMMEAKEADIWLDVQDVKYIVDLEKKGFKIAWGPGMLWALLPSSAKDPKSPYANKKVREAIEYAIDRPTMAKTLGFGKYEALTQVVPSFSPAHNPNYNPRPYNPEKAKQLLAEAGYPSGFDTKLLAIETQRDAAVAIQSYLAAVGIRVALDLADMGRFFGAIYSPAGWTDLALSNSGINPDGTDLFTHFGPRPMTYRHGYITKSPEFLAACEKALRTYEPAPLKVALQQAVRQAADDAMVIPLYRSAEVNIMRDYVHSDYMKIHGVTWYSYYDWMEKRK